MGTLVVWLLRAALVVLLAVSVLVQVVIPILASDFGRRTPEVAYLVIPYSAAAIAFVACGQVVLIAILRLLSMIGGGVIFTHRALRWVDAIIVCGAIATLLCAVVLAHMYGFVPGYGGPTVLWVSAVLFAGVTFVLLMIVMRGLLEAAVADRIELAGVI